MRAAETSSKFEWLHDKIICEHSVSVIAYSLVISK